jgi:hypothetical protein
VPLSACGSRQPTRRPHAFTGSRARCSAVLRLPRLLFALTAAAACSGDEAVGPDEPLGFFRARIGDVEWEADARTVANAALQGDPGLYAINGRQQADGYGLVLQLFNIGLPATYPLGVGPRMIGGFGTVQGPTTVWATPPSGAAGQIALSTLTDTRIAGTFSFTANALVGSEVLQVTGGEFDLPIVALRPAGPVPENAGHVLSGTFAAAPFNASAASVTLGGGQNPTLTIVGNNTEWNLFLRVAAMRGPGNYELSTTTPVRWIQVTGIDGNAFPSWSSLEPGASGSVTVTSVSTARVRGTFTGTLPPLGGGATSAIQVHGSFDVGRP